MRIGIDGRELVDRRTGVGRYLAELCTEWMRLPSTDWRFVVYTPSARGHAASLGPPFEGATAGPFEHRPVAGRSTTWWEQIQLPAVAKRDHLDVFFAPAYSAPLRLRIPVVVTMHDVSFAAHPEWFRPREGARRRFLAHWALRRAQRVIAVSAFSRDEIVRHYRVPPARIRVVHSGIRPQPVGHASQAAPLVLYVGSIFNRRHLPTLIEAFARVAGDVPDVTLAIVGENRTYPREDLDARIARTGIRDRVRLHAYISDEELSSFYARARLFVFLSEYEGFGFPPLEALAAGVPIVVGDTPAAREIYGDAPIFVPIGDVEATATAMLTLLGDETARRLVRTRAATLLEGFTWERAAAETLAVLTEAAQTPP